MSFDYYLELLLKLHFAIKYENEVEADNLRDQMDGPWWEMTEQERNLMISISEALYKIDEK